MCGIHLIIDTTARLTQEPIRQMATSLDYRGPDAVHIEEIASAAHKVFVAQNRLRITDIRPTADQLFHSPCGRYVLAYNGEIYNYQQLKASLRRSYTFQTNTDTEVLLYLLLEEGEKCLSRLNGMFAFIWYDRQEEKVVLCRDRFGMKPLFYAQTDSYLIVSSEIKGILSSGLIKKKLNTSQIAYYLQYKFAQRPATFYENIYEITPGTYYTTSTGQPLTEAGTIHLEKNTLPISEQKIVYTLEETLVEAVKRHLPVEVPVGLFLSGGVDSTLLLALAKEAGIPHLPVFSIANNPADKAFGTKDYYYARQAARQYGAEYHELTIQNDILDDFETFVSYIDQPVGDGAAWLTFLLSKEAKAHVKVILSGAGADELFAGYNRHWAYYQYLKHYHKLVKVLPALKKTASIIPTGRQLPFRKPFRLLQKLAVQASVSPEQTFLNFTAHLSLGSHLPGKAPLVEMDNTAVEQYLQKALIYDQTNYLSADILTLTDRMTMQHSLEARLPYLDAEVVKLVKALPATFLVKNGKKWLLKDILTRIGGKAYVTRPKEGFGMPFGAWLRTTKGTPFIQLVKDKDNELYQTVSYELVERLLQAHLSGKMDYSSELWTVVLLAAWIKHHFS
ncbi:asparagine synthase (glutamine-hydrolyzing) [Rhodocytophaga aerolata]|uniref:asparagine synthase (glutamine-hydrolyzing) n=1 Tax=Rhodocytophaga aerolata TaxID=455078 RepID=A0ABT8R8R9_9BACT|nr:asparagine synthase (glutamine-hydrolyzing) [Rhodocytophaga aerolata]MDO1447040.1 asparagine synthase (glutamine-hydrolyzing) [Rhodocytophaga aerolata]